MELFLLNRSRDAFVARRTEKVTKKKVDYKKGRELKYIPVEWREQFDKDDAAEWEKWIRYDAVMILSKQKCSTALIPTRSSEWGK